ncbi:TetR/AcrR family transcriptional regulator [uncultured Roseovarius sp.]|uniref:TetR/AcrR family transcriptional regulator n=1 Tax=uncultured Roseovarius sp. TaxID=293344 RepID=UPI0026217DF9|nr:TetR/AcrR family transcriptional regulator [uncultured Roseovarius sp.]
MTRTATKRLTKSDWLMTGLNAVVDAGPEALKAEPLARRLGTTKGSFYWHFSDVPAFHAALLAAWEMEATGDIRAAVAEETTPVARLRRLGQAMVERSANHTADPSIRAWARSSKLAEQAVARVDARRLTYVQELLSDLDIGNPEMARIIYAASIGMEDLAQTETGENASTMGSLVDLVLALR